MTLSRRNLLLAAGSTPGGALTPDDREAVKLLIDVEVLLIAVYRHARAIPLSAPVRRFAAEALQRERLHRAILAQLQRRRDVIANRPRTYQFSASDDQTFLQLAARVEDAAVRGYNGVLVLLEQPIGLAEVLAPIAADEAAHAGAAAVLLGQDPAPDAFDDAVKPQDTERILGNPEG
jgi:hypothetical protein